MYKIEGLYEILLTIISMFVEMAIQHPSWEVVILHERLYKKHDLHLNLSYINCTELVFWDGIHQAITKTNDMFFQRPFYKLSLKFGTSFFSSKSILFFLQQYITESLMV